MEHITIPYRYLLASILCFALSWLLNFTFVNYFDDSNKKEIASQVNNSVKNEIAASRSIIQKIGNEFLTADSVTFSKFLTISAGIPAFVFRNNTLLYWNNSDYYIDFSKYLRESETKFLTNRQGKKILLKKTFTKRNVNYSVYSYVVIENEYNLRNKYLESGLNKTIFGNYRIETEPIRKNDYQDITDPEGNYLFSVVFGNESGLSFFKRMVLLFILSLSIACFIVFLVKVTNRLINKQKYVFATLFLGGGLLIFRLLLINFSIPFSIVPLELFNPKYYASSYFSPSLGDLMLNILFSYIIVMFVWFKIPIKDYPYTERFPRKFHRYLLGSICWFLYAVSVYGFYYLIKSLVFNSQQVFDINFSIAMDYLKLFSLFAIILLCGVFFIVTHLLSIVIRNIKNNLRFISYFDLFTFAYVLLFGFYYDPALGILLVCSFGFMLAVLAFEFNTSLSEINYSTFVYFFGAIALSSLLVALVVFSHHTSLTNGKKIKYGTYLNEKGDALAEYLLYDASLKINNDQFIKIKLLSPIVNWDDTEQKIKRIFLGSYFDKYSIKICVYNADGYQLNKKTGDMPLAEYDRTYAKSFYKTVYPGLYYFTKSANSQQYIKFIELRKGRYELGFIVLDLKLKRFSPNNVFPELLVDEKYEYPKLEKQFSYALYSGDTLMYSAGEFNYERNIRKSQLNLIRSSEKGVDVANYSHLSIRQDDNRTMVISSASYPLYNVLSNFSFYFVIHTLFLLILFVLSLILNKWFHLPFRNTLTSRIQMYVNVAIFIPLLVISIVAIGLISNSHRADIQKIFLTKARAISESFTNKMEGTSGNKDEYYKELLEIARQSQTDISYYNKKGDLVSTSQPLIFETGILSSKINPRAYIETVLNKSKYTLEEEKIGNLTFSNAYFPIKTSYGKLKGIVSIPFFESKEETDKIYISIVTTVFNLFTFLFLAFVILSYFATRSLTIPLQLITQKLKKVSLNSENERIEWNSPDEIGLLVQEYNVMLRKLEESKQILAATEKEQAWKEMAKQVAHEIKNPLTPMKLKLQFLERALSEKREGTDILLRNTITTLTEQIDTLSEIATSFSSFANMPEPDVKLSEISHIVKSTVELYKDEENVQMETDITDKNLYAMADEKLLGRILTNLILNGIQSVDKAQKALIRVTLEQTDGNYLLIRVADNGSGIPENIREKVFLPNFSTKFTGSGIGLAVAKKGIESFGGSIWFDTTEGVGTTFYIKIPLSGQHE